MLGFLYAFQKGFHRFFFVFWGLRRFYKDFAWGS